MNDNQSPIRLALIGPGAIGKVWAKAIAKTTGVELAAVAGLRTADAAGNGPNLFKPRRKPLIKQRHNDLFDTMEREGASIRGSEGPATAVCLGPGGSLLRRKAGVGCQSITARNSRCGRH